MKGRTLGKSAFTIWQVGENTWKFSQGIPCVILHHMERWQIIYLPKHCSIQVLGENKVKQKVETHLWFCTHVFLKIHTLKYVKFLTSPLTSTKYMKKNCRFLCNYTRPVISQPDATSYNNRCHRWYNEFLQLFPTK